MIHRSITIVWLSDQAENFMADNIRNVAPITDASCKKGSIVSEGFYTQMQHGRGKNWEKGICVL